MSTGAPMSPNKSGILRPDKHWVLKTPSAAGVEHPYKPHCLVHALTSSPSDFRLWRNAYGVAKMLAQHTFQDRWVGRRCNDEVELFCGEGDEEFKLLKQCLEEKGFVVRSFDQPTERARSPKVREVKERKLIEKILEIVKSRVDECEYENYVKVEFGFIADVPAPADMPGPKKKRLCIARVDEEIFRRLEGKQLEEEEEFLPPGIEGTPIEQKRDQWKILGEIRTGEVKFYCEEAVTKTYFDSIGEFEQDEIWIDLIKEKQEAEMQQRKVDKKAAKKQRRKVTGSAPTTPSELSFGSLGTDGDEIIRARQRAKEKEKRKRQLLRKKEDAEEERTAAFSGSFKNSSDSEESKGSNTSSEKWEIRHEERDAIVLSSNKDHWQVAKKSDVRDVNKKKVYDSEDSEREGKKRPKVKLPKPQQQVPVKKAEVKEQDDDETRPLVVDTIEQLKPYLENGNTVMVLFPEEDDTGRQTGKLGLNYLGRGL